MVLNLPFSELKRLLLHIFSLDICFGAVGIVAVLAAAVCRVFANYFVTTSDND